MITSVNKLYVVKSGTGCKKSGTVSFSAARYMTALAGSEKKFSVNAVKRSLEKEEQKIRNSGADSAQIKRALQKIKYVMRKADEKISLLNREEKNKARQKRAHDTGRKEEAKRLKKNARVEKYFRKSNEHGNIVRAALVEKDELKKQDFSGCQPSADTQQAEPVPSEAALPETAGVPGVPLIDMMV